MIKRILAFLLLFTSIALAQSVIPGFPPGVFKSRNAIDAVIAPAASGFDPLGVGTNIALSTISIVNDTATNTNAVSTWNMARGISCKTTGKWAFEIVAVNASELMIGLLDQTTAGGAGLVTFFANFGIEQWSANSVFSTGTDFSGSGLGSSFTVSNGDIFGIQADLTAGKVWWSRNGLSLGGDPVLGTGNPGAIANNHLVCPQISIRDNGTSFKLVTGTLANPVSGYSSWGP